MKWSQFNCLLYSKKVGYFLHNTRMLSLIKLDENSYNKYLAIKNNPNCAKSILDEEDYTYLVNAKILVDDFEDSKYIDKLKYKNNIKSYCKNSLGLVICPTLACNFACPYCYEKDLPTHTMKKEVQKQLVDFINKNAEKYKSIRLSWHGGEPLVAFNTIKDIYDLFEKEVSLPISHSTMVSNGYLLSEEVCTYLEEKKLNYLQITIDGNKDTHNKTRILKSGGSSFEQIIENIDRATELMPNCRIGIRTNIGKGNREEYVELHKELSERWKNKNCSIYYTFVLDNGLDTTENKRCETELTTEEKNDFLVHLVKNKIVSREKLYPRLAGHSRSCTDNNAIVVDPQGFLYKCWADVGIKERSIGDLVNGIKNYDIISQFMHGSDKFADAKCLKCNYLPVCDGGCNLYRVGYIEKNIPYNVCPINDEGLIKYIETYLENE